MPNPLAPDAPVLSYKTIDSTMLEARRITAGCSDPGASRVLSGTVVRAEHQSAGRGRITDRRWEAEPGDGLLFTVIFSKQDLSARMGGRPFTLLPLICGLAVAEAVESLLQEESPAEPGRREADIRIKWPNDVLADGKKLCGILCEASGEWVYAGIGINLNQTEFQTGLRRPACSLLMLTGNAADADILLQLVLDRLGSALANPQWQPDIAGRLYMINEHVVIRPGLPGEMQGESESKDVLEGRLKGIDAAGALLVETCSGTVSVVSGELAV